MAEWWEQAANRRDPRAPLNLAWTYASRIDVAADPESALARCHVVTTPTAKDAREGRAMTGDRALAIFLADEIVRTHQLSAEQQSPARKRATAILQQTCGPKTL